IKMFAEPFASRLQKRQRQQRDVGRTGAQRRDVQDDFREPIIKVGAKLPLHDFTFQVAVGGGQHADLRLQLGVPADAAGFAGFEKSEQLRLEFDVQFEVDRKSTRLNSSHEWNSY